MVSRLLYDFFWSAKPTSFAKHFFDTKFELVFLIFNDVNKKKWTSNKVRKKNEKSTKKQTGLKTLRDQKILLEYYIQFWFAG